MEERCNDKGPSKNMALRALSYLKKRTYLYPTIAGVLDRLCTAREHRLNTVRFPVGPLVAIEESSDLL